MIGAALGIAALVLMYWGMFYHAGFSSGRYEERAKVEREHYAADAAKRLSEDCASLSGAALRECAYKVVNSERESRREESDLAAQWQMADWARWVAVIAGAQLLATIIGLVFIKSTLDATWKAVEDTGEATEAMRESNEIARVSNERQLRAYVALRPVVMGKMAESEEPLPITFPIENCGSTPANNLILHWAWQVTADKPTSDLFDKIIACYPMEEDPDRTIGPRQVKEAQNTIPIANEWRRRVLSGEMKFYVAGQIRYRDAFNKERVTEFFYSYTETIPNHLGQVSVRNNIR